MIYFSAKECGFYPASRFDTYESFGTWPDDAIEITDDEVAKYQGKQPPTGKKLGSDESGRPVWVDIPPLPKEKLQKQKAITEHQWVESDLDNVQVQLMYHWTSDHRASHTEQVWKDYAIALRDYTSTDEDGNPVVVGESRPSIEDFIEVN